MNLSCSRKQNTAPFFSDGAVFIFFLFLHQRHAQVDTFHKHQKFTFRTKIADTSKIATGPGQTVSSVMTGNATLYSFANFLSNMRKIPARKLQKPVIRLRRNRSIKGKQKGNKISHHQKTQHSRPKTAI